MPKTLHKKHPLKKLLKKTVDVVEISDVLNGTNKVCEKITLKAGSKSVVIYGNFKWFEEIEG